MDREPTYYDAVNALVGLCAGKPEGPISEMQMLQGQTKPTEEEIQKKLSELQKEWERVDYATKRLSEYPSESECLHALLDSGETLTALQSKRTFIKEKYPKPK